MTDDTDNVFTLIQGKASDGVNPEVESVVQSYYIKTVNGDEFVRDGFCVFTSHHLAVMRELPDKSAVPVLVFPLDQIAYCELIEDDDDFEDEEDADTRI